MELKKELNILFWLIAIFTGIYYMPLESTVFVEAIHASMDLSRWYAQEHVILCLLPAFFIAGTISVFVSQAAVLKYFGASARKILSYSVAAVSGTILAVCSCTILPLFSSIHRRGAGLGPAIAFLYSGPAINILAIILTARILGWELGMARIIGAVSFSIIIGLIMAWLYRKEEKAKNEEQMNFDIPEDARPLWQTAFHFFTLVLILVFANWSKPAGDESGLWFVIWSYKWYITGLFSLLLAVSLVVFLKIKWWPVLLVVFATALAGILFSSPLLSMIVGIAGLSVITLLSGGENREWTLSTWDFAKQILPLLAIGVVTAGFLLGSTHDGTTIPGVIPNEWISGLVGGNSVYANFFAAFVGAFMYFATLTEVPIIQGLLHSGMGQGPALALLLAGPALSLPNMLVIRSVMGTKKTIVFVFLVIFMATFSGLLFGWILNK